MRRPPPSHALRAAAASTAKFLVDSAKHAADAVSEDEEGGGIAREVGPIFRTVIVFVQIVTSFASNLSLPWPSFFFNFVSSLKFLMVARARAAVHRCCPRRRAPLPRPFPRPRSCAFSPRNAGRSPAALRQDFFTLPKVSCLRPNMTYFNTMTALCTSVAALFVVIYAIYYCGRAWYRSTKRGTDVDSSSLADEARARASYAPVMLRAGSEGASTPPRRPRCRCRAGRPPARRRWCCRAATGGRRG